MELQPFDLSLGISANLTANDEPFEVFAVGLSPQGAVKGPLVHIPNLGCEAVSFNMPRDMARELA